MQFDFQLGFGDPSTTNPDPTTWAGRDASTPTESGGMQYTQTRDHLHEHTSDSTYDHGTRTDYAYTDDTNQTIESFTSFGLASTGTEIVVEEPGNEPPQREGGFDMDYFGTGVTFQQRHVTGDGTTETVSGHQGGSWSNALNFTVHIPTYGNLVFATTQSGFDDLEYSLSHQPGRDYLGNRVTSDQQYDLWHKTSGTDSATSLSFPGITPQTSESHTRTEETRLPDGSINSHDHSWGHNNGITYDSEWDSPRTLADQMPLWLADSFPIQSPGQGPSFAFTQLNNLYWQTGYNATPVGQQWNTGIAPALTGQQLLYQVSLIAPSWTGWINNQTINGTHYEKVWAERRVLPSGRYVLTYYTAPPSENGQYLGYESDAPENQKLGRALAAMDQAYNATKPLPPNEQDEEKPADAEAVVAPTDDPLIPPPPALPEDGPESTPIPTPAPPPTTPAPSSQPPKPLTPQEKALAARHDVENARRRLKAAEEHKMRRDANGKLCSTPEDFRAAAAAWVELDRAHKRYLELMKEMKANGGTLSPEDRIALQNILIDRQNDLRETIKLIKQRDKLNPTGNYTDIDDIELQKQMHWMMESMKS